MQISDLLSQTGGLQSIARELGLSEAQARSGAEALTPAILGGFKKQAQAPSGVAGLGGLLGQLGGGGLLDSVLSPEPTDASRGNSILGQIFGSKEVSRTVAQDAASKTGLDPSLLKKMLPILTMLVAGYVAKRGNATSTDANSSGLGGLLGGLLGQKSADPDATAGFGERGLASLLDLKGDGNPLDDILKSTGMKH